MTNFELNKAIAEALGFEVFYVNGLEHWDRAIIEVMEGTEIPMPIKTFDFNNWDDLMSLVVEHNISFDSKNKRASYFDGVRYEISFSGDGEKLQRALAECLLKVLQGEQDGEFANHG